MWKAIYCMFNQIAIVPFGWQVPSYVAMLLYWKWHCVKKDPEAQFWFSGAECHTRLRLCEMNVNMGRGLREDQLVLANKFH